MVLDFFCFVLFLSQKQGCMQPPETQRRQAVEKVKKCPMHRSAGYYDKIMQLSKVNLEHFLFSCVYHAYVYQKKIVVLFYLVCVYFLQVYDLSSSIHTSRVELTLLFMSAHSPLVMLPLECTPVYPAQIEIIHQVIILSYKDELVTHTGGLPFILKPPITKQK